MCRFCDLNNFTTSFGGWDEENDKYDLEKTIAIGCYSMLEMVDDYEKKMDYAKENTSLPSKPDYNQINDFLASVNERIVKDMVC